MRQQATAYIAMGSNMGDRLSTLRNAMAELGRLDGIQIDRRGIASLWETEPVGGPKGQGSYYNSVIRVQTPLYPERLLESLLQAEHTLGRARTARNESRAIDLDLLLFDSLVLHGPEVTLPHPRMHERRFVLEPLAEIAGEIIHPTFLRTVQSLRDELRGAEGQSVKRIMGPHWVESS